MTVLLVLAVLVLVVLVVLLLLFADMQYVMVDDIIVCVAKDTEVLIVHVLGASITFGGGMVYMCMQTYLTYVLMWY